MLTKSFKIPKIPPKTKSCFDWWIPLKEDMMSGDELPNANKVTPFKV